MARVLFSLMFILLFWGMICLAQVPREMTYQGYLTDNSNNAITANLQLTFNIYDTQTGGSALWNEVHPSVAVIEGVFRVRLGSVTPLNLAFDAPYWLGIRVQNDPELSPRIALTGVGYSFYSLKADSVDNISGAASGDLGGNYPDPTVNGIQGRPVSSGAPNSGQVLKWTGSVWAPGDDNAGTSVWATSGNDIYNNNTGNVGIGTMNPDAKLDIHHEGSGFGLILDRNENGSSIIKIANSNEDYQLGIGAGITGSPFILHHSTGGYLATVTDNGNVGIGTSTPTEKLEVDGNVKTDIGYAVVSDSTGVKIVVGEHNWGNIANNVRQWVPIPHGLSEVFEIIISLDECSDSGFQSHPSGVQCMTFRTPPAYVWEQLIENKSGGNRYIRTRWIAIGLP